MPRSADLSLKQKKPPQVLILACGALAQEIIDLNQANGWNAFDLHCIPAKYHNYPDKIPALVRTELQKLKSKYEKIFVAFADCGTGGLLDKVLVEEDVERLPGAHCYAFFSGLDRFDQIQEQELGTFYLTDFFVRHFESIMVKPYGLHRPQIMQMMFANYKRVVYLAQKPTPQLEAMAQQHAQFLGLDYELVETGYGELQTSLTQLVELV